MMDHGLDRPTPIGCLVGFFGLLFVAIAGMAFGCAYKEFTHEPPLADAGKTHLWWGVLALVPAVVGLGYSVYRLLTTGRRRYTRWSDVVSS